MDPGLTGELTCQTVSTTFAQYSTAAGTNCGWASIPAPWGPNVIPAVQFNMASTASGLYPGGLSQGINLTVYNPGSADVQLSTLTVAVAADGNSGPGAGYVETTPGDTSTDVTGCVSNWFDINGSPLTATVTLDETVPAGSTISVTGYFNISMPADAIDNQDACQGANVGLVFSSN